MGLTMIFMWKWLNEKDATAFSAVFNHFHIKIFVSPIQVLYYSILMYADYSTNDFGLQVLIRNNLCNHQYSIVVRLLQFRIDSIGLVFSTVAFNQYACIHQHIKIASYLRRRFPRQLTSDFRTNYIVATQINQDQSDDLTLFAFQ